MRGPINEVEVTAHAPDPIHQFEISRLIKISIGNMDLSFTNVSLFTVITVVITSVFLFISSSSRGLVPTRMQSLSEMAYEFVASTLRESSGVQGMQFFPLVFLCLLLFWLLTLLVFSYFYTVTSQIMITFSLAMVVILTVVGYGFISMESVFEIICSQWGSCHRFASSDND